MKGRQATVISKDPLFFCGPIYKRSSTISVVWIYCWIHFLNIFWNTLDRISHDKLCSINVLLTSKKLFSFLNSFLRYWTFRNPTVWLVESSYLKITQDLELCPASKLGWEIKHYNNSSFRLSSRKPNDKTFKKKKTKKKKMPYFGALLEKI